MSENNRQDEEMRCVYMGPPMKRGLLASLKQRFGEKGTKKTYPASFADDRDPDDDPRMIDVYAGPGPEEPEEPEEPLDEAEEPEVPEAEKETEEEPEPAPASAPAEDGKPDPRQMEGVYAGPPFLNSPMMATVYAGPEQMRGEYRPVAEAVYAAPRKPDSPMMLVYAGPAYFQNRNRERMADEGFVPMPPRNSENDGKMTVCRSCGSEVLQGPFCPECGTLLPTDLMIRCPVCGGIVRKAKFCAECGTRLLTEEESRPTE